MHQVTIHALCEIWYTCIYGCMHVLCMCEYVYVCIYMCVLLGSSYI